MILVGDPNQLGPVVKQHGNPLERSLLQRLLEPGAGPELPLPMLSVQHRMNAAIEALVDEVYDDIRMAVSNGKQMRLEAQLIIQQLDRGSVVWPDELTDELLDEAHELIDFIETHDVLGRVRLR